YLLMAIPNVEGFTAMLFLSGYILGVRLGIITAVIAALLYFGLNPQGGLFLPLLAAQIAGVILAPIGGVIYRKHFEKVKWARWYLGLSAFIITLIYDILTNLAFPLVVGFDFTQLLVYFSMGVPFSLIHIVGNILIFVILIPPALDLIRRHLVQLSI
ncbi:MAG: hypothetical protein V2A61_05485, partial [Calditrichota bacterium]